MFTAVLCIYALTSCDENMNSTTDDYLSSKTPAGIEKSTGILYVDSAEYGTSTLMSDSLLCILQPTDSLSLEEIDLLYEIYLDKKRERDLFAAATEAYPEITFGNKFKDAAFSHMNGAEKILNFYGIEIADSTVEAGIFADSAHQADYNAIAGMFTSVNETYKALCYVEEKNIYNFSNDTTITTNYNILVILKNLIRASQNHLRGLSYLLGELDDSYSPSIISEELYDEIINSPYQKGNRYKNIEGGNTNVEKGGKSGNNKKAGNGIRKNQEQDSTSWRGHGNFNDTLNIERPIHDSIYKDSIRSIRDSISSGNGYGKDKNKGRKK